MKTIGLIGGMSAESTVPYYRIINAEIARRLGGLHSARIVLYSVDFHDIEAMQSAGRWDEAGEALAGCALALERAGADFLVLCTNTMHKVAPAIEAATRVPLLHVADATAEAVLRQGYGQVGLLGTRFTMEGDFLRERLRQRGVETLVPAEAEREIVHRVIYEELCRGEISEASRARYVRIIAGLAQAGAQAVVLGCTEIGLLVRARDTPLTLFDTASIHALAAVEFALQ